MIRDFRRGICEGGLLPVKSTISKSFKLFEVEEVRTGSAKQHASGQTKNSCGERIWCMSPDQRIRECEWPSTYPCACPGMTAGGTVTCVIVQRRTVFCNGEYGLKAHGIREGKKDREEEPPCAPTTIVPRAYRQSRHLEGPHRRGTSIVQSR